MADQDDYLEWLNEDEPEVPDYPELYEYFIKGEENETGKVFNKNR